MATIQYNKLVRDRIPEIIEASGKKCTIEILYTPISRVNTCKNRLNQPSFRTCPVYWTYTKV